MKWFDNLPRKYYKNYKKVNLKPKDDWFDVYKLPENVFAICEPRHFQEVNSFLIIGSKKSLLIDTGMGISNIKKVVESLYQGEIIVVNTHFHFDHIAENYKFDKVYTFNEANALKVLRKGLTNKEYSYWLSDQLIEEIVWKGWPEGFNPDNLEIPSCETIPINEGHIFDLGDRKIEVIHTPGHSEDSIMLIDRENKLLFTGDTFYLGPLYAHFDSELFGTSNIMSYKKSLEKIIDKASDVNFLYPSHNEIIVPFDKLGEAINGFDYIIKNKNEFSKSSDIELHSYTSEKDDLIKFQFDGFSIITAKKQK